MATIQVCPPAPAHTMLRPVFQFDSASKAVSAETGIAFSDYAFMQTKLRRGYPKFHTPQFVFSDRSFQRVIVAILERQVFGHKQAAKLSGTLGERLQAAERRLQSRRTGLLAALDRLCREYTDLKAAGDPLVPKLEQKITEIDSRLRFLERPAAYLSAILYLSWRLNYDSVSTAAELGLKAPSIRATLARARKVACEMGLDALVQKVTKPPEPHRCRYCKTLLEKPRRSCDSCKQKHRRECELRRPRRKHPH